MKFTPPPRCVRCGRANPNHTNDKTCPRCRRHLEREFGNNEKKVK